MTDSEKIRLIGKMISDFYGTVSDVPTVDAYGTVVEMISTVVLFGGADDDE